MSDSRDRLHSMDLVPEHAQDDVVWAVRELNQRRRSNNDILFELNDRLAVKGVAPISSSAFSRKAVRLKALRERARIAREVIAGVEDQTAAEEDDETRKVGRMILVLIAELIADGEDRTPKQIKEIADAFKSFATGQKVSADRRRKMEADADAKAAAKTVEAVQKVAKEAGLSRENLKALEEGFFEVFGGRPTPKPTPRGGADDGGA